MASISIIKFPRAGCAILQNFNAATPDVEPCFARARPRPMRLYPYIYVNADGTARELHASERRYLETEFSGGDGAAPYIKDSYDELNGWGELKGYLNRSLLPARTPIHGAPADVPIKPMSQAEHIEWLRSKGVEVVANSDGSFTMLAKTRH
jgi:hypothetical protein